MAKKKFKELSNAKIGGKRIAIISMTSDETISIAQRLDIEDSLGKTSIFIKGAIHIESKDALIRLRDAINVAIDKL